MGALRASYIFEAGSSCYGSLFQASYVKGLIFVKP